MPIHCVDGEITDEELCHWEAAPLRLRIALPCAAVRAVFEGPSLSRGIALLALNRAQFDKLFPLRSRRKNACTLRRWASKIRGERARAALALASWHQLRAAAAYDEDEGADRGGHRTCVGSPLSRQSGEFPRQLRDLRRAELHDAAAESSGLTPANAFASSIGPPRLAVPASGRSLGTLPP